MAWAHLFNHLHFNPMFFSPVSGSSSQPVLTQTPSMSVSPGNTVKLSCTWSINDYAVFWYQQKPGNSPRFLLYYSDSNKHQGSGVPTRFSGSKDTSGNAGYLTISGALAEDEADYYCAVEHNSAYHSDTVRRELRERSPTAAVFGVSANTSHDSRSSP
uniref:Ig-like domain-containing protein n=1 Tax=Pelusios castaneus TaxID=367368 RepID=A0A8C8VRD3_9SAUR